jgi:proline dehydrogenase
MTGNPLQKAIISAMPLMPQPLIWRFSRRYIAGTELADAYRAVSELNALGCTGTIDVLGEDIDSEEQVAAALALYREALDGIRDN